jgi:formylglycine-generating enzyme required for sulfatase activity
MNLFGQRRKKLQEALIDAFPSFASLEQMLLHGLDKNLRAIAGEGSLRDVVFRLIQTAHSQGWIEDLIRAAREDNPGNQQLKDIARELLPNPNPEASPVSLADNFSKETKAEVNVGRRQILKYSFFALMGVGGVAGANVLKIILEDARISSKDKVSSSSPSTLPTSKPAEVTLKPSVPTQKPNKVTPKPAEVTPKPEPYPSLKSNISNLAKDSFSFETVEVNERGKVINREPKTISMWIEDLGEGVQLEMVYIPEGIFTMGSPADEKGHGTDESSQREVTVQAFLMGRYAVTQSQWKRVSKLVRIQTDLRSDPSYFKGNLRPVERVNWYEAKEFCDRLSSTTGREYRLPTEVEWEYACRANTTTPFYFGDTITTDLVNYDGSVYGRESKGQFRKETTIVGNFPPNAYGLFDMHGNIWEWCADYWDYKENPGNRSLLSPDRRGGSPVEDSVGVRILCVPKMNLF